MTVQVVTVEHSDLRELSLFIEKELKRGRAIVPGNAKVELFDEVILRIVVNRASLDIVATVAHPALPDANGAPMLGLAVNLSQDERHTLNDLLESLNHHRTISGEHDLDLDIEVIEDDLATTNIGRPIVHSTVSRPSIARTSFDDMFDSGPNIAAPAPDTPVQTGVLQSMIDDSVTHRVPSFSSVDENRPIRGSVDAIIDSVARGEASSEHDAFNRDDAGEAARYRAAYPDKAMRADDYYRAAMADARNRKFELARTNVNLAIAYNPTVPEYRELLEQVELELGVHTY